MSRGHFSGFADEVDALGMKLAALVGRADLDRFRFTSKLNSECVESL